MNNVIMKQMITVNVQKMTVLSNLMKTGILLLRVIFYQYQVMHMRCLLVFTPQKTEEGYKLVKTKRSTHADVPPGDKSGRFMVVDNSRNLPKNTKKEKKVYFV